MPIEDTIEAADAEARRRFRERAEEYVIELEEEHATVLPGNHTPAESILLAHLMTAVDGYNRVELRREWSQRPKSGLSTTLVYLAQLECGTLVEFALESRCDQHARQLAIIIDDHRPGERIPQKTEYESRLSSVGFRVLRFTALEILSNPEACRERAEGVLSDISDDLLADAGVLQPRREP